MQRHCRQRELAHSSVSTSASENPRASSFEFLIQRTHPYPIALTLEHRALHVILGNKSPYRRVDRIDHRHAVDEIVASPCQGLAFSGISGYSDEVEWRINPCGS